MCSGAAKVYHSDNMKNKPVLALVGANAGVLQNGLLSLLLTIPQVKSTMVTEDVVSVMKLIQAHQPGLVLLDDDLLMVEDAVRQIKSKYPKIKMIVLIKDISQQENFTTLGTNAVLVKGFSARKLIAKIEDIMEY